MPRPFFEQNFRRAVVDERSPYNLGKRLTELVQGVAGTGGTGEAYSALADKMLTALRDLVATTEKQIDYLGPPRARGQAVWWTHDRHVEL